MNIPNHDIEELLRKYHAGHISKEEFDRLKETVNRLEDEELKFFIGQHWDSYTDESPLPEAKKARIYQALERKIRVPMHIRLRTHWAQIAASLLLVLSVGLSVLFYSQHQELQQLTSRNVVIRSGESPSSVTLPDGTKVKNKTVKRFAPQSGTSQGNFAFLCLAYEGKDIPEELRSFSAQFPYNTMASKEFDPKLLDLESGDSPMTMAGLSCEVTARAEQIPRICIVIGLSFPSGAVRTSLFSVENNLAIFLVY